tara:strand:- start:16 stop:210 length:195 start_codon:yes stop_codon:yes gene_type:complete
MPMLWLPDTVEFTENAADAEAVDLQPIAVELLLPDATASFPIATELSPVADGAVYENCPVRFSA